MSLEKHGEKHCFPAKRRVVSVLTSLVSVTCLLFLFQNFCNHEQVAVLKESQLFQCQTFDKVSGGSADILKYILGNDSFINGTISKLQNAVRIPTEVADERPDPGTHPDAKEYLPFYKLHEQLKKDFPLVWSKLDVKTVNNLALLITWKGSNESLKPLMFAAHLDVVPVEKKTWDDWKYPPFSAFIEYDSENILDSNVWGRGTFDDKNMLVGELQAVELLLSQGFQPERGIILALGCDEEASGQFGAAKINEVLVETYGDDGIYAIVDEGLNGIKKQDGVYIASPGTAEKGFINFWIHLNTPGGHSSVPPDHTSIGIISSLVTKIESKKFPLLFTEKNPVSEWYQCAAQYSEGMDKSLRYDFLNAMNDEDSNARVIEYLFETGGKKVGYLLRTSQAVDIIHGGFKSNALPETVSVLINSRVAMESSVNETMQKFVDQIKETCKEHGLGLQYEGTQLIDSSENGEFSVEISIGKDPVPSSPNNDAWKHFAGTVKSFYEDIVFPTKFEEESTELVIAPTIMSGNTDCLNYLSLTQNIYRFQPGFASEDTLGTIHSVNEHVNFETVMHTVAFVYHYINAVQPA
ncbi:unnamed protein product [Kluyveromyces dobzhanskii CBS 2104]|uniref:WGS project CCBQ000000000 data, contig 00106 n=1 Tax=Kluyveromyces dobzhanskii CBS 2104 TaxID=1427455 RepID=A0A0A8L647_9SACH|nr:unnamed protein product [Kluyveromyces dobzhanskii CBS 2104]